MIVRTPIEIFVSEMTLEEMEACIKDYQFLEENSYIGDSFLRDKANYYIFDIICSINDNAITSVMKDIAFECYKVFTEKYFETIDCLRRITGDERG